LSSKANENTNMFPANRCLLILGDRTFYLWRKSSIVSSVTRESRCWINSRVECRKLHHIQMNAICTLKAQKQLRTLRKGIMFWSMDVCCYFKDIKLTSLLWCDKYNNNIQRKCLDIFTVLCKRQNVQLSVWVIKYDSSWLLRFTRVRLRKHLCECTDVFVPLNN